VLACIHRWYGRQADRGTGRPRHQPGAGRAADAEAEGRIADERSETGTAAPSRVSRIMQNCVGIGDASVGIGDESRVVPWGLAIYYN
jgi:hypothetical protein